MVAGVVWPAVVGENVEVEASLGAPLPAGAREAVEDLRSAIEAQG